MAYVRTESYKLSKIWREMWARCTKPTHPKFKDYGARGITVCRRWKTFTVFEADMAPRPGKEFSLERRNNNKGYSPSNCRWATAKEQSRNKRNNIWITFKGKTLIMADWAILLGLNKGTLRHRIVVLKLPPSIAFKLPTPEFNKRLRGFK